MPVKQDAKTREGEELLSKRVSRRVREADFVYQGFVWGRGSSKKQTKRGRLSHDPFTNSLVKIELDAAQALADFSRLVHMPSKRPSPNNLKWPAKRRRSIRSYEAPSVKVESSNPHGNSFADSQRSELNSMASLSQNDKSSPALDSRAESPSSPLPASKLECGIFLGSRDLSSKKSAFQRVTPTEPLQKSGLTSIKLEKEDLQSETVPLAMPNSQTFIGPMPLCSVKIELQGEQEEGHKNVKTAGAMVLANLACQLVELSRKVGRVVLNKPKSELSEEDKEARRQRRIQANRESARQTIRKKQILCEDLRRQAASLASENEGMKQKKETLIQELLFLKGQNYHLKTELEMEPSCNLEPGDLQHSQGIPVTSPAWQLPSLPYAGFSPAWPRMIMMQGGAVSPLDWPNKIESLEERSRSSVSNQCMQLLNAGLMVTGIPVNYPMCVTGVLENNVSSVVPTSSPKEESGAGGAETLKSSGASCDIDSAISNVPQGLEKELEERGTTLCQPTALIPCRADSNELRKTQQSKSRGTESTKKNHLGLPLALPVTYGSSCTGNTPLNGLYATQRMAVAAAAAKARKRRMELARKKRTCGRRSKVGM